MMGKETDVYLFNSEKAIEKGLHVLQSGGVIAFPTDTVYGIAVSAFDPAGIEKLYAIKRRENIKAIAVLIGSMGQIHLLASRMPHYATRLAELFWPGALTLVVPALPTLPVTLSPTPTVGVRMPDHDLLRKLIDQSGPLATTSANLSGGANSLTAEDVLAQLNGRIDLILDGGKTPGEIPSTVIDCTVEKGLVLREGALTKQVLSIINEE